MTNEHLKLNTFKTKLLRVHHSHPPKPDPSGVFPVSLNSNSILPVALATNSGINCEFILSHSNPITEEILLMLSRTHIQKVITSPYSSCPSHHPLLPGLLKSSHSCYCLQAQFPQLTPSTAAGEILLKQIGYCPSFLQNLPVASHLTQNKGST